MGLHKATYWWNIEDDEGSIDQDLYDDQTIEHGFHQSSNSDRPLDLRNCILLDNQSTVHAFCNANFVEDIWNSQCKMTLLGDGGKMSTNRQCSIPGLQLSQPVWFHEDYITNVLSLALLTQQYRITYDSDKSGSFIVHRQPNKPNLHFIRHKSGLHYFKPGLTEFTLVETVADNKEGYSKRQLAGAKKAG